MTAFRILDPFPAYLGLLGLPAAGGTLRFFETGTDTPKDVFGDPDLTVNNGSSVLIGTDGRTVHDIWGDGAYRVRLYASDNTLIAEAEDVELPGGAGLGIPALANGKFLTNDGAVMSWADVLQVPDPTGSASKILGTDGVNLLWQAAPTVDTPDTEADSTSGSFKLGKFLIQWGTGTAPATGTRRTSLVVTYPKPYIQPPFVMINPIQQINSAGLIGTHAAYGIFITSFTAQIDANIDSTASGYTVTSPVPFNWIAIGQVDP